MENKEYKRIFNEMISRDPWWKRLIGSQFIDMITTFVGQVVSMAETACKRYLQESFLSTATKRASILAAAEDKGFIGRKIMPSIGICEFTNKTDKMIAIPQNSILTSKASIQYINTEAMKILANSAIDSPISQLVLKVFKVTVKEEQKFLEVILPKDVSAIAHRVDVFVTSGSGALVQWEKRFMFRRTSSKDRVYTEFYKPTEQLGVRFGNGVNGAIPPIGRDIVLNVWTTNGDTTLLDGQTLELDGKMAYLNSSVDIVTKTSIVGGAAAASDTEIKSGALYVTSYDEQIVWQDDYIHYIKQNLANIIWCNAWGEAEMEIQNNQHSLENINSIFISAFSSKQDQTALKNIIIKLLTETKYLNKQYKYIDVVEKPFSITLTGTIIGSHDLLHVEQLTKKAIDDVYGRIPKEDRKSDILEKDVNKLVDELNLFYDFSIEWNYPAKKRLEDYIYLDVNTSTFNISYLVE